LQRSTVDVSFVQNRIALNSSEIELIDLPEIRETSTIGNAWIVGSSTNGIVGTNTGTQNGLQQIVGAGSRGAYVIQQIVNHNFVWRTLLSSAEDAYWTDTGNTTATVDTSANTITFTAGQQWQSNKITTHTTNLIKATLSFLTTATNLTCYLSADNGVNWETVTNGVQNIFVHAGTNIKIKIVASGSATITIRDAYGVLVPMQVRYE